MRISETYMTSGISAAMTSVKKMGDVLKALERFKAHDWGNVPDEDVDANTMALTFGDRILGAYDTDLGEIWIIADAVYESSEARRVTILFPSEY